MGFNWVPVKAFLRYFFTARTRHAVHSPYVYKFVNEVVRLDKSDENARQIEALRKKLLQDKTLVKLTDFGEAKGLGAVNYREESLASVTRKTSIDAKFGRFIARLARFSNPRTVVEIGTSIGISTSYISKAIPQAHIITLEGCPEKTKLAAENFKALGVSNVEQVVGRFDDTLPKVVKNAGKVDLAFIDGNHTYRATKLYFEILSRAAHENTVMVLDDIHWSEQMEKAWDEIRQLPQVTVSIDLFRIGIVFLRTGQAKQHFVIRF